MKLNRRVTIITRFSGIMFSLLLLGGLAACSDEMITMAVIRQNRSRQPTPPLLSPKSNSKK